MFKVAQNQFAHEYGNRPTDVAGLPCNKLTSPNSLFGRRLLLVVTTATTRFIIIIILIIFIIRIVFPDIYVWERRMQNWQLTILHVMYRRQLFAHDVPTC